MADMQRSNANTILDHVDAFRDYSRHEVYFYDPRSRVKSRNLDFNEFDVVVLHYSIFVLSDGHLHPFFRANLARYQGLKIQFIQDDYRQIDPMCARIRELGIHVLFTLYSAHKIDQVYSPGRLPGVAKFSTLAGYVPDNLLTKTAPPSASRRLDVGYRGREVPYWLGHLGQEKTNIVKAFHHHVHGHALSHDVSCKEEDRIYGQDWPNFIASCRTMLGTESGSSVTDFDGSAEAQVRMYLESRPDAPYEEVHSAVLRTYEGNVVHNCISPRAFETAAMRTAMVLFPGEYSGILKPWVHYIPLEKDFSNFPEVVQAIKDDGLLTSMANRAFDDLVASGQYSYRSFIREFDEIVERHATHHGSPWKHGYELAVQEPVPKPAIPWRARLSHLAERAGMPPWLLRKLKDVAKGVLRPFRGSPRH
jgi:hypothetical protein